MTPETATLYRQVAQALDARGVEYGLLDWCEGGWDEYAMDDKPCTEKSNCAGGCRGTGTVVPSEAECHFRLANVARETTLDRHLWARVWVMLYREPKMLDALLRAVAQGLGLAVTA